MQAVTLFCTTMQAVSASAATWPRQISVRVLCSPILEIVILITVKRRKLLSKESELLCYDASHQDKFPYLYFEVTQIKKRPTCSCSFIWQVINKPAEACDQEKFLYIDSD